MGKKITIEGTIKIEDEATGEVSSAIQFNAWASADGNTGWERWDGNREQLGESADVPEWVQDALTEWVDRHGYPEEPMDVWLRIPEGEEEAEAEANTYQRGIYEYEVQWYLNSVGLVSSRYFTTYEQAAEWLEAEGFQDFSS